MIYHNGRPAGQVWHNGKRVREVWHMGKRIFPTRNPAFGGYEAVFEMYEPYRAGMDIFIPGETEKRTYPIALTASTTTLTAVVSNNFRIAIEVDGNVRVVVESDGNSLEAGIRATEESTPMPSGTHLLQVTTSQSSDGSGMRVYIDGAEVLSDEASGTLFGTNSAILTCEGNVSSIGAGSVTGDLKSLTAPRLTPGYVAFTPITRDVRVASKISGGESTAWLIGGGEKGQAGDLRGKFKKGYNGRDAPIYQVPSVPFGSTVTIGKGSTKYGTMGTPTVFGQYSSDMSTTRNTTLTAWGATFDASQYGAGGKGGIGLGYLHPVPDWNGDPGADGALVLARRWP